MPKWYLCKACLILLGALAALLAPSDSHAGVNPLRRPAADTLAIPPGDAQGSGQKSTLAAFAYPLLGTLLPVTFSATLAVTSDNPTGGLVLPLLFGGLLIGPSAGQFYAGSTGPGLAGIAVRGLGAGLFGTGLAASWRTRDCREGGDYVCKESKREGLIPIGIAIYLGGAFYSLFEGIIAADRYNGKQLGSAHFGWAPVLVPTGNGSAEPISLRTGALAWARF
jgi:hypothetical protein